MAHSPNQRLRCVDVLRGMAMLAVFFHHLPGEVGNAFGRWQVFGGRSVDLVLVLSGFLTGTTCLQRAALPGTPHGQQAGTYWLLGTARTWRLCLGLLALYAPCPPGLDAEGVPHRPGAGAVLPAVPRNGGGSPGPSSPACRSHCCAGRARGPSAGARCLGLPRFQRRLHWARGSSGCSPGDIPE